MKKILINKNVWQTRVAVLQDEKLQDIYFDTHSREELEKCFFKGKVSKLLPGIQTAFVDIGQKKAGFLHISEIDRALATEKTAEFLHVDDSESDIINKKIKKAISIEKIFSQSEDILVQVIKEPIYEKGAKLTTCFTLPGKFVVLMPNIPQIGISKKIEDREERARLKEILLKSLPKNMGAIIRTTMEGRKAKDLKKDISFLISTWKSILKKFDRAKVGEKIHEDLRVTLRAVREHFDEDVEVLYVDDKHEKDSIQKFVRNFVPEHIDKIKLYQSPPGLFEKFEIDKQIDKALSKKVSLRSGGTLIIETTEAMTVIDVNTGKFTGKDNLEETILKTNLEAADEIVQQLRLRNIGGLIVIDFIDMSSAANKLKLSKSFEKTLKERDKYQSVLLKVSEFGLIQMTRKRSGKTLTQQLTNVCTCCNGYGVLKSTQTRSFEILTNCKNDIIKNKLKGSISLTVPENIFDYLIHHEFQSIIELEKSLNCKIVLEGNKNLTANQYKIESVK
ncbi:MAG: cytoplasmic axial filament protein (Ribonuclease G) [candidate division TM6 bacterium GW2011_GWF2_28_16]|nr:MAG: cytoplasmic axial filament protein (Ribonuclease G) [candidate division TM6 bacterium GW2011_GWF2_28_16]